jgi:hypothetical protein
MAIKVAIRVVLESRDEVAAMSTKVLLSVRFVSVI